MPGSRKYTYRSLPRAENELTFGNRVLLNVLWCAKMNRDKQNGKYDQYKNSGDDRDPSFRMVL